MIVKALLLCMIGAAVCVEVHFENKDGGFFLKHTGRGAGGPGSGSGGIGAAPLSVDRFTVFQTARAVSVRASYGPFSTKQTVPARSLVPDPLAPFPNTKNASAEQTPLRLDMSAHVVSREISRDSPVIRILFHTGGEAGGRVCGVVHATMGNRPSLAGACSPEGGEGACLAQLEVPANWWGPLQPTPVMKDGKSVPPQKQPPKMVQLAYSILEPRTADPEGGGCMPRVQIQPATRLGSVQLVPARAPFKELHADDSLALLAPRTPLYPLARFHLPVFVRHEEIPVTYFVMRCRVKSGLRLMGATTASDQWTTTVELKPKLATVTAVRKDFSDQQSPPNSEEVFTWVAEAGDGAAGRGSARLSCSVRYARSASSLVASPLTLTDTEGGPEVTEHPAPRKIVLRMDIDKDDIQAVLPISKNWEVLNTAVITGRQVSQAMKVLIVSQAGQVADVTLQSSCHSEDESVLKVSSSCSSVYVDGSEIRSSSNASVIVKYGTYTGLARFTVWLPEIPLEVNVDDFRLSQVKGWKVPEEGNSNGLSKSRGLKRKRRSYSQPILEEISNSVTPERHSCRLRFQQSPVDVYARFQATDHDSGRVSYLVSRRTWLRVTELVLPLLRVADPRLANLKGRLLRGKATGRTEVQVLSPITGRVIGSREIRVGSDKVSISRLIVRVISGLQLNISPDNAIENGYISETTVTRRLTAQYQEGLLDIDIEFSDGSRTPLRDVAMEDYVLKVESLDPDVVAFAPMVASHHPRVIAVGEGNGELLRVTLLLSEECRGAAGVIPKTRGSSKIDSGGNSGTGVVLATATASVEVDFSASEVPQRPDTPQNDDIMRGGAKGPLSDLQDILIGIPLKDENNHEPTVQARQLGNSGPGGPRGDRRRHAPHMTPVEIGMYILLAAFCCAIVIFVISCVVYASKFKPMGPESITGMGPAMPLQPIAPEAGKIQVAGLIGTSLGIGRDNRKPPRESTTNAHDWVWLGRATIERHTGHQVQAVNRSNPQQPPPPPPPPPPPHASDIANRNVAREMRITNNPLNVNYADPEDAIKPADNNNGNGVTVTFDNSNHLDLNGVERRVRSHSNDNRIVDSTTYCKRDRVARAGRQNGTDPVRSWQPESLNPPPLPPHAVPIENHPAPPEEYRPPVPPHRTTQPPVNPRNKILADTIMPPTRRGHHSRHHWKAAEKSPPHNSQQQAAPAGSPRRTSHNDIRARHQLNLENVNGNIENGNTSDISELGNINLVNKAECSGMFEFDEDVQMVEPSSSDAPRAKGQLNAEVHCERDNPVVKKEPVPPVRSPDLMKEPVPPVRSPDLMKDSGIGLGEVVYRPKVPKHATQSSEPTIANFVEIASDSNGSSSRGSSPEVKRATIVGNPMFSGSPSNKSITDELPTESLGLDDLEMDYEQIMHYFHNLKESNA